MSFVAPSDQLAPNAVSAATGGAAKRVRKPIPRSTCSRCSGVICAKTKTGLCRSCSAMSKRPSTVPLSRNCSDCGTPISQQSKGRCKSCATAYYNRLPETKIKRAEGWKKRLADPEKYAQVCRVAARNSQKAMADPVKLAEAQERARNMYRLYLDTPESRAKVLASRARAGRKLSEYRLAWCPPEYRELHHENVKKHRIPAALSREMIERRIANDKALKNIEDALYFLRKFAPVQVLENGYRYGNAILTPAEIIARAKVRGWQEKSEGYPQPEGRSPSVPDRQESKLAA
jgi:hypothetical protein